MTRGRPATPAERIAMGRRLMTAGELGDRHKDRVVKIGGVEGILVGIAPVADKVMLTLHVGTPESRLFVPVQRDEVVEVWRAS